MLSKEQTQALSELRGFLTAFEYVNNRDDHGYMFEVWAVPKKPDLDQAIEVVFAKWRASKVTKTAAADWKEAVSSALNRWLLAYLKDSHHLIDRGKHFLLSTEPGHQKFSSHVLGKLAAISEVQDAYTLDVKSEELTAHAHDDILLVCQDALLFLHFEICD